MSQLISSCQTPATTATTAPPADREWTEVDRGGIIEVEEVVEAEAVPVGVLECLQVLVQR